MYVSYLEDIKTGDAFMSLGIYNFFYRTEYVELIIGVITLDYGENLNLEDISLSGQRGCIRLTIMMNSTITLCIIFS